MEKIVRSVQESDNGTVDISKRRLLLALSSLSCLAALPPLAEPVLAAAASVELERKIDRHIKALRREGRVAYDERTAWSVYDFTLREKLVSINENTPLQSASMIKPFIALAFFYRLEDKRVSYDRNNQRQMEAMLRWSSNRATNYFIDLLDHKRHPGRPQEVERILKSNAPGIFQETRIIERIPNGGATYRNRASARDYSRFLYAVWHDQFPFSDELRRLMQLPKKNRIKSGVEAIPPETRVYDKTGTTARLCGDMGIVEAVGNNGKSYPYTFIGIIEKTRRASNFYLWRASRGDVIREISDIVYSELRTIHNLV